MPAGKQTFLIILVAVIGLAAGVGFFLFTQQTGSLSGPVPIGQQEANPNKEPEHSGNPRPGFVLKDLEGNERNADEWNGKVILLNFWATWCPPCRREIPDFIRLQEDYADKGFVILGIALDTPQNAIDFVDPMGINYPVLIAEQEGIALTKAYGNRYGVLPYTIVIDRNGIIREIHKHEIDYQTAESLIKPYL